MSARMPARQSVVTMVHGDGKRAHNLKNANQLHKAQMGKKKFRDSRVWQSEVMQAQDDNFNFDASESTTSALMKFKANKDMWDVI